MSSTCANDVLTILMTAVMMLVIGIWRWPWSLLCPCR